jgi:hypothetical protein
VEIKPRRRWWLAGTAILAVLVTTTGLTVATPAAHANNTCPADFAFVNDVTGEIRIALRTNCGTTVTQLTSTRAGDNWSDHDPAMSPDGSKVAFTRATYDGLGGGTTDVFYVARAGGDPVQVTHSGGARSPEQ